MKNTRILIIGAGPAGYTAAIYAARAGLDTILVTGLCDGGQLTLTKNIENWPGVSKPISGISLVNKMRKQVTKLNVKIIADNINYLDLKHSPFHIIGDQYEYYASAIIIATGSSERYLGLDSEKKFKGKGVSTCAICDGFFHRGKKVAVIGGGNTAIEEAIYLSRIVNKVYIIHRRKHFTAENILIKNLMPLVKLGKVIIYYNHVLNEIIGNDHHVTGIKILSLISKSTKIIKNISGCFIAIGRIPNTQLFVDKLEMNNAYIKIIPDKNSFTKTSVPGVFAAGDVVDSNYRQAITASAMGCMAAIDAERFIRNSLFEQNLK